MRARRASPRTFARPETSTTSTGGNDTRKLPLASLTNAVDALSQRFPASGLKGRVHEAPEVSQILTPLDSDKLELCRAAPLVRLNFAEFVQIEKYRCDGGDDATGGDKRDQDEVSCLHGFWVRASNRIRRGVSACTHQYDNALLILPIILVALFVAMMMFEKGSRLRIKSAAQLSALDRRPPVIYLRSFADETAHSSYRPLHERLRHIFGYSLPGVQNSWRPREQQALSNCLGRIGQTSRSGAPGNLCPSLVPVAATFRTRTGRGLSPNSSRARVRS